MKKISLFKNIKVIFSIWKLAILLLPLVLLCGEYVSPKLFVKRDMGGYTDVSDFPHIDIMSWWEGDFQKQFEKWWNDSYGGRTYIIPAYNQIRYSFFNLTVDTMALGKDKSIQRIDEINDALQLSLYDFNDEENKAKMEQYASNLGEISSKLAQNGVKSVYFLTPSKAHWEYNGLPLRYKLQAKEGTLDGADLLADCLKGTELTLIDCRKELIELEEDENIPIYYKTGVHWSAAAEQKMIVRLLEEISKLTDKNLGKVCLGELQYQNEPYYRDADGYNLLNIYKGRMNDKYYYYDYSVENGTGEPISVLLSGGSYNDGFISYCTENNLLNGGNLYFVSYNNYIIEYNGTTGEVTTTKMDGDFSIVNFEGILSKVDVVIFEGNDGTGVPLFSSGFVDYLYDLVVNNGI